MNRRRVLLGIASAAIGAVGWSRLQDRRKRQTRLDEGRIRDLAIVWTRVNGCRLYGRVSDPAVRYVGLPVVMVHGWGVSGSYLLPTAERLAVDFAVAMPDLPGHGRSQTPRKPLPIPDLSRVLLGWMDALGIGSAIVVAHSMGCQIAAEAAVQAPSRVARLVLVGPTSDPSGRSVVRVLRRAVRSAVHERLLLAALVAKDCARMGWRLVPEFRFMLEDRMEDKLPKIAVPAMLIRGGNDWIASRTWIEAAARMLHTDQFAEIPEAGHAVPYSAPEALVRALHPLLRQEPDHDRREQRSPE